ncbi:hypothetical protein Dimus_029719 [Dionaea muscipula]
MGLGQNCKLHILIIHMGHETETFRSCNGFFLQIENLKKALVDKEAMSIPLERQTTSACEKPKIENERTPLPSRRLSIENKREQSSAYEKPKSIIDRAPLQSRRRSLEPPSAAKSETLAISKSRRFSIEDPRILKRDKEQNHESEGRAKMPVQAPRPRRHSIENPHAMNSEKVLPELTVQSSRRLSAENSRTVKIEKVQNAEHSRLKEHKPSREGKLATTDRTPPGSRRHSIENPSAIRAETTMNTQSRKDSTGSSMTTKCVAEQNSSHVRRLNLEGQKNGAKRHLQIEISEDMCKYSDLNSRFYSPEPSFNCLGQITSPDNTMQATLFQAPQAPEPISLSGNDFEIAMYNEFNIANDFQTPGASRSAHGKESQIKRSLRTINGKIGKLINGSDKRNQQKLEARTRSRNMIGDVNLLVKTSPRALRRPPLNGLQPVGPGNLHKSLLGGKSS